MTYDYPNCTILRVHDGDTIFVDIDMGLGLTRRDLGIRFAGINAPEIKTQAGKDALAFLLALVKPGEVVHVESLGWDNYGDRIDGRVYRPADGPTSASLGEMVLAAGHAVPLGPYTA